MKHFEGLLSDNWHFNISYLLILLAALTLPFSTFLMPPIATLLILNCIIEWNWKEKGLILRQEHKIPALVIFTSLCLINIYGFFISYNKGHALSYFDCHLWFFVAPVTLLTYRQELLDSKRIRKIFGIFTASTTAHIATLFCIAFVHFLQTGKNYYFFYESFSILLHPTYISMYATMAFFTTLQFLYRHKSTLKKGHRIALLAILALQTAGIVCLSSKAAILVFIILGTVWGFYLLESFKKRIIGGTILLTTAIILFFLLKHSEAYVFQRFENTFQQIMVDDQNHSGHNSTQIRLATWKSSWEVSRDNFPWGVGTGDVNDELGLHAIQHNYKNLIGKHFNAHNQYLQNTLSTGVFGLGILLVYCLFPLGYSIRKKDILYSTFSVMIILNILVESMFEVRAGVDFIALFNILLFCRSREPLND